MILQGLSAETLARLVALARYGDDYSGLLSGPSAEQRPQSHAEAEAETPPEFRLAAE
jgi:hypothetical protein